MLPLELQSDKGRAGDVIRRCWAAMTGSSGNIARCSTPDLRVLGCRWELDDSDALGGELSRWLGPPLETATIDIDPSSVPALLHYATFGCVVRRSDRVVRSTHVNLDDRRESSLGWVLESGSRVRSVFALDTLSLVARQLAEGPRPRTIGECLRWIQSARSASNLPTAEKGRSSCPR